MRPVVRKALVVFCLCAGAVACSSDAVDPDTDASNEDVGNGDADVTDPDGGDADVTDPDGGDADTDDVPDVNDTNDVSDVDDADTDTDDDIDTNDADTDVADVGDADADVSDADVTDPDATDVDTDVDSSDDADVGDADDADIDGDITDTGDVPSALWIEIGTGVEDYEPFDPDEELTWTQGFQGGFHVWTGFRAHGFDPRDIQHEWLITNDMGTAVGGTIWNDALAADADGVAEMYGVQVVLGPEFTPEMLEGEVLTITLTIIDPVDVTLTATTTFTSRCCDFL